MMVVIREPPAALRRHAMKTVQDYLATAPHLFQVIMMMMMIMMTTMPRFSFLSPFFVFTKSYRLFNEDGLVNAEAESSII